MSKLMKVPVKQTTNLITGEKTYVYVEMTKEKFAETMIRLLKLK